MGQGKEVSKEQRLEAPQAFWKASIRQFKGLSRLLGGVSRTFFIGLLLRFALLEGLLGR